MQKRDLEPSSEHGFPTTGDVESAEVARTLYPKQ